MIDVQTLSYVCYILLKNHMSRGQSNNFRNERTRNQNWTNDKNITTVKYLYVIGTDPVL